MNSSMQTAMTLRALHWNLKMTNKKESLVDVNPQSSSLVWWQLWNSIVVQVNQILTPQLTFQKTF